MLRKGSRTNIAIPPHIERTVKSIEADPSKSLNISLSVIELVIFRSTLDDNDLAIQKAPKLPSMPLS